MVSAAIAELAFAVQAAKGTPAAAATRRIYLRGGSLPGPVKDVAPERYTRTTRIAGEAAAATAPALGTPFAYVRPEMIGTLLYAVLGAKSVSGGGDPYTHVFTLGSSLPYLTFFRHFGGILNERVSDARIGRLTLSGRSGDALGVEFEVMGSPAYRTAQEASVAVETANTFLFRHGSGALKIEGAAVASIADFALAIDAAVVLVETPIGPLPFLAGLTSIRLRCRQKLTDASLWNRMIYANASPANNAVPVLTPLELAGSPAGIEFTWTAQASPERSLRIALPRVVVAPIEGFEPDANWRAAEMAATYTALAPAGGGSPITATLKNAVASY